MNRLAWTNAAWATALVLLSQVPTWGQLLTYDGKYDISKIQLTVAYFVPQDRTVLPDWQERVGYFARRITEFHHSELDGTSALQVAIVPQTVRSSKPAEAYRQGDGDFTYRQTLDDVRALINWQPPKENGFPILLVLSDINWRELDDFHRTRAIDGKTVHEGHVAADGRHFPGAESGGARAAYFSNQGFGGGLVSADGWRVPYSGSDCVVYHEGIGHTIGLPHPDPVDQSVMGTGQYHFWLSETWLNEQQKLKLGWRPRTDGAQVRKDLFSAFKAVPSPAVPHPGEMVSLELTWPPGATPRSLNVQTQTELFGKWQKGDVEQGVAPARIALGAFPKETPVSYRINVELTDGQRAELWGYFQVKTRK